MRVESAYADPKLLRDLGARGARFAADLDADVIVGAETAGVPLAAAISQAAGLPFAFVRKPDYRGDEIDEPPTRGADVARRRVLLVDDAVSSGTAVERFAAPLTGAGAEVIGVFVVADMREVADIVTSTAAALPTQSVSTYLEILSDAAANGILDPAIHKRSVDAVVNTGPTMTLGGSSFPRRRDGQTDGPTPGSTDLEPEVASASRNRESRASSCATAG